MKQLSEIVETYLNGNISDFKADLKKLDKRRLLDLVQFWPGHSGQTMEQALNIVRRHLN